MADAFAPAETHATGHQQAPEAAAQAPHPAAQGVSASASGPSNSAAALHPAGPAPSREAVRVLTAQALQQALLDGTPDIEVRAHMDLRGLSIPENPDIPATSSQAAKNPKRFALLYARASLQSLRVRSLATAGSRAPGVPYPTSGRVRRKHRRRGLYFKLRIQTCGCLLRIVCIVHAQCARTPVRSTLQTHPGCGVRATWAALIASRRRPRPT